MFIDIVPTCVARGRGKDVLAPLHLLLVDFDDVCMEDTTIHISPRNGVELRGVIRSRVGILCVADAKLDSFFMAYVSDLSIPASGLVIKNNTEIAHLTFGLVHYF